MIGILIKDEQENIEVRWALDGIGVTWNSGVNLKNRCLNKFPYALYFGYMEKKTLMYDSSIDTYENAKADMENKNHEDPDDNCSEWFHGKDVIANPNIVIEAYKRSLNKSEDTE